MDCSNVKCGDRIIVFNDIYTVIRVQKINFIIINKKNGSYIEVSKKKGKLKNDDVYVKISTKEEISDFNRKKFLMQEVQDFFIEAFRNNIESIDLEVLEDVHALIFKER